MKFYMSDGSENEIDNQILNNITKQYYLEKQHELRKAFKTQLEKHFAEIQDITGNEKNLLYEQYLELHLYDTDRIPEPIVNDFKGFAAERFGNNYIYHNGIMVELFLNAFALFRFDRIEALGSLDGTEKPAIIVSDFNLNPISRMEFYEKATTPCRYDTFEDFAYARMLSIDKISHSILLNFDEKVSENKGYSMFSKQFKDMINSDVRDPESKAAAIYKENNYFRSDTEERVNHSDRNKRLLMQHISPKNRKARNLIYIHYNSTLELGNLEAAYFEWRTRIDLAWRIYYVFTSLFEFNAVFPKINGKRKLDETVESIIGIITSCQDGAVRNMLVDVLHTVILQRIGDPRWKSDYLLENLQEAMISFSLFESQWEKLRRDLISGLDEHYRQLLADMCCSFYEIANVPDTTYISEWYNKAIDQDMSFGIQCLLPLKCIMSDLVEHSSKQDVSGKTVNNKAKSNNKQMVNNDHALYIIPGIAPRTVLSIAVKEKECLEELMNSDEKGKLFTAIWEICFETVQPIP